VKEDEEQSVCDLPGQLALWHTILALKTGVAPVLTQFSTTSITIHSSSSTTLAAAVGISTSSGGAPRIMRIRDRRAKRTLSSSAGTPSVAGLATHLVTLPCRSSEAIEFPRSFLASAPDQYPIHPSPPSCPWGQTAERSRTDSRSLSAGCMNSITPLPMSVIFCLARCTDSTGSGCMKTSSSSEPGTSGRG
jgi:hypothetical protein